MLELGGSKGVPSIGDGIDRTHDRADMDHQPIGVDRQARFPLPVTHLAQGWATDMIHSGVR